MKKLLNISDFAKISGVSRQTLIYYHRIGLFMPAFIANNKYRMYSHNQVDNLGIITILSDLGVPLKKIKEILTDISAKKIEQTLNYQLKAIQDKIEKLSLLKDMTQTRLEQIEEGKSFLSENGGFIEKELEDTPIFVGNNVDLNSNNIDDETVIEFFDYAEKFDIPLIFSFGFIKNVEKILLNGDNTVSNMWFRLKNIKYANAFIPKGKYLIGYAKGDYGKTDYVYKDLEKYVKKRGLTVTGNVYEEYLIDELSEKNPDDFVLRITVKIE